MAITVNKVNIIEIIRRIQWTGFSLTIPDYSDGYYKPIRYNLLPDWTDKDGYILFDKRDEFSRTLQENPRVIYESVCTALNEIPNKSYADSWKNNNLTDLFMYIKIKEAIKMGTELVDYLTGEIIQGDDYYVTHDNEIISQDTFDREFFECEHCGEIYHTDDERSVDGSSWCLDCTDSDAWWCDYCEEYHSYDNENYYEYHGYAYCNFGLERMDLAYCSECDRVVPANRYNYHAHMCYSCYGSDLIRGYHDAPSLRWFGTKARLAKTIMGTGFELEVDDGCDIDGAAQMLHDLLGEQVYFEEDGSLSSDGFEIISQPMTDDYMRKTFFPQIDNAFERLVNEYSYRSHDTDTCGLHFHFSKELFGYGKRRDRALEKFVLFFEDYYNDIVKFSRRKESQCDSWARKYLSDASRCNDFENEKDIKDLCKGKKYASRYHAVNLTNYHTIEVRIMRGTLNPDTFKASYDFLYTLIKNSKKITYANRHNLTEWFKGMKPETIAYMKSRNAFEAYTATV